MKKKDEEVVELPHFIDAATWGAFVAMRIKIKKPMTNHAMNLIVRKLIHFNGLSMSVNEILEQSIINNYLDVYPLKNQKSPPQNKSNPLTEIDDYINKAMAKAKAKNGLIDIN